MSPVQSNSGRNGNVTNKTSKPPKRSASFHGKVVNSTDQRQLHRPRTHPDLLAATTTTTTNASSPEKAVRSGRGTSSGGGADHHRDVAARKTPVKVLLNVAVQKSMWPLQVMALAEWSVEDLIAAVLRQYVKEGRRPQLPSADPSKFGLHYSQFSLECLDPKEKLIGLESRNFFLCTKEAEAAVAGLLTANGAPTSAAASCSNEAEKAYPSKTGNPWLRFMEFLL